MSRTIITTDKAPAPVGPYSQAVRAGDFLFLSGSIAIDPATGQLKIDNIEEETKLVMNNMKAVLDEAGATLKQVAKVTIFLRDMNDFTAVNGVYAKYFTEEPPARACVQAARLPKDVNVEIECIAYLGS